MVAAVIFCSVSYAADLSLDQIIAQRKAIADFALQVHGTEHGKPSYRALIWKRGARFRMDHTVLAAKEYGGGDNNSRVLDKRQIFCIGYDGERQKCHLLEGNSSLIVYSPRDNEHGTFTSDMLQIYPDPATLDLCHLPSFGIFSEWFNESKTIYQDQVVSQTSLKRLLLPIDKEFVYDWSDPKKFQLKVFDKVVGGYKHAYTVTSYFKEKVTDIPYLVTTEEIIAGGTAKETKRIELEPMKAEDQVPDPFCLLGLKLKNGQVITTPELKPKYLLAYVDGKTIPFTQYKPDSIMRVKPDVPAGTPPVPEAAGGRSGPRWEVIAAAVVLMGCAMFFLRRWWKS